MILAACGLALTLGIIGCGSGDVPSGPTAAVETAPTQEPSNTAVPVEVTTTQGSTLEFPSGHISWADAVASFTPGDPAPTRSRDPGAALGEPDYQGTDDAADEATYVSLGHGGELILELTDNALVNGEGPDLAIFEIGPEVESILVAISKDGIDWTVKVGRVEGSTCSLDIEPYVGAGQQFRFIRLTDGRAGKSNDSEWPGADINAVGAINTVPRTSAATPAPASGSLPGTLIRPEDLAYVGAFRLPDDAGPPRTFEYGGNAMTFNPDGDPASTDPYPGSLFVTGHDRIAYGALPDGNQVAEISIPVPATAANPADLPQAAFIQGFHDVTAGYFTELEEIPKVGLQYLNHPATGPKIHLAWGQHLQLPDAPSHAWFDPTLAAPGLQGIWFVGDQDLYSTNGYMFDIPTSWADAHAEGRYLATGRMRDGGQGGMGPALFAYRPWLPDGSAPPTGAHLEETTLLLYESVYDTPHLERCLQGYQHADEWEGGAWLTTPSGKSAVLFAGTKSTGSKFWYGYINPAGPEHPCVDSHVTDYDTCRMADGSSCPAQDYAGCCDEAQETCVSYRGWWSTRFDAQFILYDPADLAQVAAGAIEPWEPQPYASVDIDEHLYLAPPEWDLVAVGWDVQRRYRIGAVAYDRNNALLYVLELYGEGAKPVVHVWRVED